MHRTVPFFQSCFAYFAYLGSLHFCMILQQTGHVFQKKEKKVLLDLVRDCLNPLIIFGKMASGQY